MIAWSIWENWGGQTGRYHASCFLPVFLPSMANARLHWAVKATHVKSIRQAGFIAVRGLKDRPMPRAQGSVTVEICRMGRKLDDDNLAGACKALRDGIAEALGVDDGSGQVIWRVRQKPGIGLHKKGCEIVIEWTR